MARISTPLSVAFAGRAIVSAHLIEVGLPSTYLGKNALYLTESPFSISYDTDTAPDTGANTYTSDGVLLGVGESKESGTLAITGCNITLSGLEPNIRNAVMKPGIVNQSVSFYRVFLDEDTYGLVDVPLLLFKGKVSSYQHRDGEGESIITLAVKSNFADFEKTKGIRTNQGSLKKIDPNEYGFEFSHESVSDIKWGKA
jgi:hypothetical protein